MIMKNKTIDNTKLGMLVLAGFAFLIFTLYMIGKNRNLLGSTFSVKAVVSNVNGLVPGNNVRFKGIDVGTVKSISIANDTAIIVVMTIDQSVRPFIKKNAIVSIGTDGLMGNKLININSGAPEDEPIHENAFLQSRKPIETDEMLRTLNTTNNNIERITSNLYEISVKLNSSESMWSLLSDTAVSKNIKQAIVHLRNAGENSAALTKTANNVVGTLNDGQGLVHQLFRDTTLSNQLAYSLLQIKNASNQASSMMSELKDIVDNIRQGDGTAGMVLADTVMREKLFKTALNLEQGTDRFNQNMEALKSNFLFRKYFKKLEKQQAKESRSAEH